MSWIVTKLSMQGIEGIPDQAGDFELAQERSPRSIAIYDSGAGGKSGYADAVEYLFSEDGSLAEERGIEPRVSMTLVNSESGESVQVTRLVKTEQADDMPPELRPIVRAAPARRILRRHDLRRFVVDMTPGEPRGQDAAELSRWFGLTHLEQVLKHLEATSSKLAGRDLSWEIVGRVQDIARHTDNSVTEYDERAVLDWCEAETERNLGKRLAIDSVEGMKKAIRTLKRLQGRIIVVSSATAGSYQAKLALEQLATGLISQDGGQLQACHTALTDAVAAERQTERLLTRAKNSVFQEVWDAAQGILESQITGACPVCRTPWRRTRAGSQEAALITITRSRDELAELAAARNEQQKATRRLKKAIRSLEKRLARVSTEAKKLSLSEIEPQATELVKAARTLVTTGRFPSQMQDECEALLGRCHQFVAQRMNPALQGLPLLMAPVTTTQVEAAIEHFHALWDALIRLKELHREQEEYHKVKRSFDAIAEVIQERAAALVNDVVAALEDDVQSIYQTIHPTDAVPNIYIVPDTESRTLRMRVGFHSPDELIPPAGYPSESQMNTLGLALFISSVGLFNREFPFLFLDDVFCSYDADHRERIVDVVAERLDGFQVFLTTHDWRLYSMLKDRLHDKGWLFERIEEG
ncbi:MAG: hypothetical protein ISS50_00655 [Anaerolineae bacterium]|nr:hypothetical protein [Anaerolineae bacterium]